MLLISQKRQTSGIDIDLNKQLYQNNIGGWWLKLDFLKIKTEQSYDFAA